MMTTDEQFELLKLHSQKLNAISWMIAETLNMIPDGAFKIEADPLDLASQLCDRYEELTKRLKESDDLLRYALHLRMYGENAPGGKETWQEFDRRVNYLLRWHLVADEGWEQFGTHANDSPMPTLEFSGSLGEDGLPLWERVVKETDDTKRWQPASDFISRVIQENGLPSDDTE